MLDNRNRGFHALIDIFLNEYPESLHHLSVINEKFENVVNHAQLNVVKKEFNEFKRFGLTGFYMLSESHLAFHTWPEKKYIAVDLFTCGMKTKAEIAIKAIEKEFSIYSLKKFKVKIMRRGFVFGKNI